MRSPILVLTLFAAANALATTPVLDAAAKAEGKFTDVVYEAFLQYSEAECMAQLQKIEVELTPAQLAFVRTDRELREACFGTYFPPDARVIMNLLEIRQQLGEETFRKYRGLCIANAVVRRHVGMGSSPRFGEKEEYWAAGPENPAEYRWFPYSFIEIDEKYLSPRPDAGSDNNATAREGAPERERESFTKGKKYDKYLLNNSKFPVSAKGYDKFTAFLKANKLTPSAVYADQAQHGKAAIASMGEHAPPFGQLTRAFLDEYMAYSGLRPERRDRGPSAKAFIEYIDRLEQRWDADPDLYPGSRFPVKTAPWPIMFPLAKGWPIREAEDILKRHEGASKLQTYGKYQNKEKVLIQRYLPHTWHYDSWQGKVQAGGVCHQMSTIGTGTYQAFGTPACKAGSGNHSFLAMFFARDDGTFGARTKQGAGGWSQWAFCDPYREVSTDFHKAFALALSLGTDRYMKSRIAVNVAKTLKAADKTDLAIRILQDATQANRYNPEVWFYLAHYQGLTGSSPKKPAPRETGKNQLARARYLAHFATLIQSSADSVVEGVEFTADTDFSQIENEGEIITNQAEDLSNMVKRMGRMVGQVQPVADRDTNREMYELLSPHRGSSLDQIVPTLVKLQVAINGWESESADFLADFRKRFDPDASKQSPEDLVAHFSTIVSVVPEDARRSDAYLAWLKATAEIAQGKTLFKRFKSKIYLDKIYASVMPELLSTLEARGMTDAHALYSARLDQANSQTRTRKKKEQK